MSINTPFQPRPSGQSGRRRITTAQLKATAGLTGVHPPTSPGQVLSIFKKAAPALQLSRHLVDLIDQMMSLTKPCDWLCRWRPIVWPSNDWLADRLGLEISRVKELIRSALDTGLFLAVDGGNRKRYGKRGDDGRILYAYGFDLSPLAERMPSFQLAAAEHEARREEAKALRRDISRLRSAILNLCEYGGAEHPAEFDWLAVADQARETAERARHTRDPLSLAPIANRLATLHQATETAVSASLSVDNDPWGPENRPHNTTTKQLQIDKSIATAAKQAQEMVAGDSTEARTTALKDPPSALRGFPITPNLALQIAPAFRGLVSNIRPTWQDISDAAYLVRANLGISQLAYGQACLVLGRQETATAIAAISAKHAMGLVRSPGGLLRHMIDAHLAGTLRLDRTLFGLVDKTKRSENNPPCLPRRAVT